MKTFKILRLSILLILMTACQKQIHIDLAQSQAFILKINFKPTVDAEPLSFGNEYKNHFQEPYSVQTFKFYISNIELMNTDSNIVYHVTGNNYFLVDASDPASTTVTIQPVSHQYNRIAFFIGVDSVKNVSGAQTGALDPAKGMFWTWNSGYIMAKLEGSSPLSDQPDNRIEYHIGGFKGEDNVVQKIELPFPSTQSPRFSPGTTSTVTITANINSWFFNPNDLQIKVNPSCTTPGDLAKKIAQNYSKMFTITDIENN